MQLRLSNLACERDERVLFSGLSAEFHAGEIVQIVGDNGAGKTTLLRCICGLTSNFEGEVRWGEVSTGDSNNKSTNKSYDFISSLLYLGHTPGLNTSLSAIENLRWFFGLVGFQAQQQESGDNTLINDDDIIQALAQTGMRGYEYLQCRYMSAGQQRRVALARLYCTQAPLWILDEPFTAIDKKGVAALEVLFDAHRKRGGIIILTSHQTLNIEGFRVLDLTEFCGVAA